jgi:hypothetical protein
LNSRVPAKSWRVSGLSGWCRRALAGGSRAGMTVQKIIEVLYAW